MKIGLAVSLVHYKNSGFIIVSAFLVNLFRFLVVFYSWVMFLVLCYSFEIQIRLP